MTVYVRAQDETGKFGSANAMDLDDESFRRFVLDRMANSGVVIATPTEEGERVPYRTKPGVRL